MIQKETWRKNWLNSINELTSLELQKRTWLDVENTNPHWSFVEFLSCYFDDLVISDYFDEILGRFIKQQEYDLIKDWHEMLSKYNAPNNDSYNHKAILEDSNWLKIVEIGKKSKDSLAQILKPAERNILEQQINVA